MQQVKACKATPELEASERCQNLTNVSLDVRSSLLTHMGDQDRGSALYSTILSQKVALLLTSYRRSNACADKSSVLVPVQLDGATGKIEFTANGDRRADYIVVNIQRVMGACVRSRGLRLVLLPVSLQPRLVLLPDALPSRRCSGRVQKAATAQTATKACTDWRWWVAEAPFRAPYCIYCRLSSGHARSAAD